MEQLPINKIQYQGFFCCSFHCDDNYIPQKYKGTGSTTHPRAGLTQPGDLVRKWLRDQLQQGRHTVTTNRIRGQVYVTKIVFDQSTKEIQCYN